MRVLSVNVGSIREVQWKGETFTTAIFKAPVDHPVKVHGVNLEGDDQADRTVHGGDFKAVYAYSMEDYSWWSEELGSPQTAGQFGENLTTTGIDLTEARIGERWRVGTALLEVTGPRLPCFKLGMRMEDPTFLKKFSRAMRPGVYFRILEPGIVAGGDKIEVVSHPETGLTVRTVAGIYLFERHRAAELIDVPALDPTWNEWAVSRAT